jgi:hypothetical protein
VADISVSLNGVSVSFAVSDADVSRILAAYTALLTKAEADAPTSAEVVAEIGKGFVAGLAQTAIRYEQEVAAKAAAEAVPSIDATLLPA